MNLVIAHSDEHTIAIPAWLMQTLGLQEGDQVEAVVSSNTLHLIAPQHAQGSYADDGENRPDQLEELVAQIKALPPSLSAVHPATKSVDQLRAELKMDPPSAELFTFQEWQNLWSAFEEEQKALELTKELAEEVM